MTGDYVYIPGWDNYDTLQETPDSSVPQSSEKGKDGKTKRIAKLTQEQKDKIADMATPIAMPRDERKRQYAALRRAVVRSCEPALLAKFSLSSDGERWGGWMIEPPKSL